MNTNMWNWMAAESLASLEDSLKAGKFVLTAEITPPVSCDRDDLLAKAVPLRGLADAVNVTDGAGARAHMDSVTAATILKMNGIEPILQLTCRDRNRHRTAERVARGLRHGRAQPARRCAATIRRRATSRTPSRSSISIHALCS